MANPRGNPATLKPAKKGEVRNPKGINGFTYRAKAEEHLANWCKRYGKELISKLLNEAKKGDPVFMRMALDRILPAVQAHEVTLTEPDGEALASRLAGLAVARRGNGHDTSDDALREEGT